MGEEPLLVVAPLPPQILSQEGHILRVATGSCIKMGPCIDLSSSNSFCSILFSSVRLLQHFFSNSQFTSVCFSLFLPHICIINDIRNNNIATSHLYILIHTLNIITIYLYNLNEWFILNLKILYYIYH